MKKALHFTLCVFLAAGCLALIQSCKEKLSLPVLTTLTVSDITQTSATVAYNVTDDGGAEVINHGVAWGSNPNPVVPYSKSQGGSGTGSFAAQISGLEAGKKYHVRAFATNGAGTAYGNELVFTTNSSTGFAEIHFNPILTYGTVADIEGNVYKTIQTGSQNWMAENLKTAKFNDGSAIPNVTDDNVWSALTTPAFCWYQNDPSSYKAVFGALYNWFAASSGKLCPAGWHVPSTAEWADLINYLGGENEAGGKLKEGGNYNWFYPNTGATNESGFTALPGGIHNYTIDDLGPWIYVGSVGSWWSSDTGTGLYYPAMTLNLYDIKAYLVSDGQDYHSGLSVRCLKD